MTDTLASINVQVTLGNVIVSEHAYDRLRENDISIHDIEAGILEALLVEDYPEAQRGPSLLALQFDANGNPLHVVWGLRKGTTGPAVLITAYRPDPLRWTSDFRRRL